MQVFGRDVPASADLWNLYSRIVQTPDIWMPGTFKAAATRCGLRKIAARKAYFSFSGQDHVIGQAPVVGDLVEELRLFIGTEPKDLDEALYKKDRRKIGQVAAEYSDLFRQKLGTPRAMNGNDIFECGDDRVRVLPADSVWVVISKLSIVGQLPHDHWAAPTG